MFASCRALQRGDSIWRGSRSAGDKKQLLSSKQRWLRFGKEEKAWRNRHKRQKVNNESNQFDHWR